jgi:uncharacterized membrane protein
MADILTLLSGLFRIIFGFLLVLVIPGFFLTLVLFPRLSDLRFIERLVYSLVMSIGSVIINILFMDIVLGINTTPLNIVIILAGFSLVLGIIWFVRRFLLTFSLTEKISKLVQRK